MKLRTALLALLLVALLATCYTDAVSVSAQKRHRRIRQLTSKVTSIKKPTTLSVDGEDAKTSGSASSDASGEDEDEEEDSMDVSDSESGDEDDEPEPVSGEGAEDSDEGSDDEDSSEDSEESSEESSETTYDLSTADELEKELTEKEIKTVKKTVKTHRIRGEVIPYFSFDHHIMERALLTDDHDMVLVRQDQTSLGDRLMPLVGARVMLDGTLEVGERNVRIMRVLHIYRLDAMSRSHAENMKKKAVPEREDKDEDDEDSEDSGESEESEESEESTSEASEGSAASKDETSASSESS